MAVRKDPRSRRPELLLLAPGDHFELGSTIRSAAGLGWERTFIEDPHQVWFGCDRGVRAKGRAAARRGKNEILLIPCRSAATYNYPRVTVITCKLAGVPLHRINLAGGPSQIVVIPDESRAESVTEDWNRFGAEVEFAQVQLPNVDFTYHYRLMATIGLAEISRQVGRRPFVKGPPAPRPPIYDHALGKLAEQKAEIVSFDELLRY